MFDKKFYAKDADYVEGFEDGSGKLAGFACNGIAHSGGGDGDIEDVVVVAIFDDAPICVRSISTAGGDDGDFFFKRDKCFEDGGHAADGGPRGLGLVRRRDANLPFAVVSEVGGFEDRRAAQVGDGAGEVIGSDNGAERRQRKPSVGEKRFFADAMLRRVQDLTLGPHGRVLGGGLRRRRGNVFKFEGHHADGGGEAAHGVEIVIRRDDFEVGDLPGRRIGVWGKGVDAIAHAAGGDGEHAS